MNERVSDPPPLSTVDQFNPSGWYGASENVDGGHTGFLDLSVAKEVLGYEPEVNMMSFRSRFVASHPQ